MAGIAQELSTVQPVQKPRRVVWRSSLVWLPVWPFFSYVTLFLLLPSLAVAVGAFQKPGGGYTLAYVRMLFEPQYRDAFSISIRISITTALTGGIIGLFVAYSATKEGAPG